MTSARVAGGSVPAAFVEELADVAVEFEGDLSDFFAVAAQGGDRFFSIHSVRGCSRHAGPAHEGVLHAHCVGLAEALHDVYFFAAGQFCDEGLHGVADDGCELSRRSG